MSSKNVTGRKKTPPQAEGGKRIAVGWASLTKFKVPIPVNEAERMAALHSYQILNTPPEDMFNDLVALASYICGTPIALISLVDAERQWFKAKVGLTATETARDVAFCAHAIMSEELFVVQDALTDPRFAENPLVRIDPKIRFYAGAPLMTADHHALGTLCVIDRVPRELSAEQKHALKLLGRQVIALLDCRRQLVSLKQGNRV